MICATDSLKEVARRLVAGLAMQSLIVGDASAQSRQTTTIVLSEPRCPSCTVSLRAAGQFGASQGDGLLRGRPVTTKRDRTGRVFISAENGGATQVFDSTGKFIRLLGRLGSGPGEMRTVTAVVPLRDGRLLVYDPELLRVSVFDETLHYQSSRSSQMTTTESVQWNGDTLISFSRLNTPNGYGLPLHVTTVTSENPTKSLSFDPNLLGKSRSAERHYPAVVGNFVCTARANRLAIFCSKGVLGAPIVELTYKASWFRDDSFVLPSTSEPASAVVRALVPLSQTELAVVVSVPSPSWRQAVRIVQGSDGPRVQIDNLDDYWDSIILVVDVDRARMVASGRVPQALFRSVGVGFVSSLTADETQVALWRVHVGR